MFYYIFKAGNGYAGLVSEKTGIIALFLPNKRSGVLNGIRGKYPGARPANSKVLAKAAKILQRYFDGEKVSFSGVNCDISSLKPFTRMVLKRTCKIPYGETNSYKWVGQGKSRAAGNALGSNPIPVIIPCHRVIKSDKSIGGFGYGVKWKKKLLELEKNSCIKETV
jgi:methylated-DNA-[protein]-cysteine S-methyltransferase